MQAKKRPTSPALPPTIVDRWVVPFLGPCPIECGTCDCVGFLQHRGSPLVDDYGDRKCWCDSCHQRGCGEEADEEDGEEYDDEGSYEEDSYGEYEHDLYDDFGVEEDAIFLKINFSAIERMDLRARYDRLLPEVAYVVRQWASQLPEHVMRRTVVHVQTRVSTDAAATCTCRFCLEEFQDVPSPRLCMCQNCCDRDKWYDSGSMIDDTSEAGWQTAQVLLGHAGQHLAVSDMALFVVVTPAHGHFGRDTVDDRPLFLPLSFANLNCLANPDQTGEPPDGEDEVRGFGWIPGWNRPRFVKTLVAQIVGLLTQALPEAFSEYRFDWSRWRRTLEIEAQQERRFMNRMLRTGMYVHRPFGSEWRNVPSCESEEY